MIDTSIDGSYMRELRWSTSTPDENDQARTCLFEQVKSRSFVAETVTFRHVQLMIGLVLEDDHILVWYKPLRLDGKWPGGDYILRSVKLRFDTDAIGGRMDLELLPGALHGQTAWKRQWGIGFPQKAITRRFPMIGGDYKINVEIRGEYRQQPEQEEKVLASAHIPSGHCWPGYGAGNDLMVRQAPLDLYDNGPAPSLGAPPPPTMLAPYLNALDRATRYIERWNHCPRSSSNWQYELTPYEGYAWNDRYQGFYLSAFTGAYALTEEKRYFQVCEYLYNSIVNNIMPGFWGGPTINQGGWGTGDNLLKNGIVARSILRLCNLMGDNELGRPVYDVFKAWPRDSEHDNRLINVVFPDMTEQRKPLVFNQVMSSVAAVWPLAEMFGDEDLLDLCERVWRDTMVPGLQPEGFWFYVEGRPVVTQHYDLVMKADASLWLDYDRWAEDEDFLSIMCQGMNFSLRYCTELVDNMLVWHPFYSGKWEPSLSLGKAGMGLEIMTRLLKLGKDEFTEPARQTIRYIDHMRTETDELDLWASSWMSSQVITPLFDAASAGLID